MRTLILSDLHLGNGGEYDIFAGSNSLPALLDRFVDPPTRVILNGDTMDFLLNDDPLLLYVSRAVDQAQSIAAAQPTVPTLNALGRICAGGGEVLVRMGNHDVELALPEVQEVFRDHLGQPPSVAKKMTFERGQEPHILDVGGAKILFTHGEQNDSFNQVDYDHLPGPGASGSVLGQVFEYSPGSLLVKELLNPLKKKYHMRFADLLKPDIQGGVLTALGVDSSAAKVVLKDKSLEIIRGIIKNLGQFTFVPGGKEASLAYRFQEAGLTAEEIRALKRQFLLGPETVPFNVVSDFLDSLHLKLARTGLKLYAHAQRQVAGAPGMSFFTYEPDEAEMKEAQRLANKYGARVIITGHSHAARWKQEGTLLHVNTGTWIWLMRLPDEDASEEAWAEFLQDLRDDPKLEGKKNRTKLEKRFTPVIVEPRAEGGATVSLHSWEPSGELRMMHSATVRP